MRDRRIGWRRAAALAVACTAWMGCVALPPPPAGEAVLLGEATYRERMALPSGATLEVRLLEQGPGEPPREIAAARVDAPRSVPIPFTLHYDPDRRAPGAVYRIEALILVGERPWFATPVPAPEVRPGRQDEPIVVLLQRVR
jgi:putative lipoprotein